MKSHLITPTLLWLAAAFLPALVMLKRKYQKLGANPGFQTLRLSDLRYLRP